MRYVSFKQTDTYKKDLNEIVPYGLSMDWETPNKKGMTVSDFNKIRKEIPTFVAVFEVVACPEWAKPTYQNGDIVMFDPNVNSAIANNGGEVRRVNLTATALKFVKYAPFKEGFKMTTDIAKRKKI